MSAVHRTPADKTSPADPFDTWSPREYLADYYARVDEDEAHTLAFLAHQLRRRGRVARRALAFGVGPTVHHLLALAPWAESIDAADYLDGNLREVQRWLRGEPGAHDWSPFAARVLACERASRLDAAAVQARQALVRRRVVRLLHGDAARHPALAGAALEPSGYDLVMSCYCAESATADWNVWRRYMRHILALLQPGGLLLMAALRRCRGYKIGPKLFPAAGIDEADIDGLLDELAFDEPRRRVLVAQPLVAGPLHGYEGIVLLACERRRR
jgi:SAM-dependent methyltransferase